MENFEQKYNEMVKRARELHEAGNALTKRQMEIVCPELTESEDEKMEEIIEYLRGLSVKYDSVAGKPKRVIKEWVAYLEKQKAHSMSAEEVLTRAGLKPYKDGNQWCILAGDNIQEGICGFGDTIDEALYQFLMEVLEKQKEQKPILKFKVGDKIHLIDGTSPNYEDDCITIREIDTVNYIGEFKEGYVPIKEQNKWELVKEQKPVEWSEEDEAMRLEAIRVLVSGCERYRRESGCLPSWYKTIDWLKSLRPQPKQEWSEEDRRTIDRACVALRAYANGELPDILPSELLGYADKLQSLRPQPKVEWGEEDKEAKETIIAALTAANMTTDCKRQAKKWLQSLRPSWKPSEEQMYYLKWFATNVLGDGVVERATSNVLYSLYDDLKKLK